MSLQDFFIIQNRLMISEKKELIKILLEAKYQDQYFGNGKSGSIFIDKNMVKKIMKPIFDLINTKYKIKKSWLYHMESKEALVQHFHNYIVGVYYLQVNQYSGELFLHTDDIRIKPKEGMFVIIPAKENHSILQNKSNMLRISLCMELEKIGLH